MSSCVRTDRSRLGSERLVLRNPIFDRSKRGHTDGNSLNKSRRSRDLETTDFARRHAWILKLGAKNLEYFTGVYRD